MTQPSLPASLNSAFDSSTILHTILATIPPGRHTGSQDKKHRQALQKIVHDQCQPLDAQSLCVCLLALTQVLEDFHPKTQFFTSLNSVKYYPGASIAVERAAPTKTGKHTYHYHSFLALYALQHMSAIFLSKNPDPDLALLALESISKHFNTYTRPPVYPMVGQTRKDPEANVKAYYLTPRDSKALLSALPWTRAHQPSAEDFCFIQTLNGLTQYLSGLKPSEVQSALKTVPFVTLSRECPPDNSATTYIQHLEQVIDFLYTDHLLINEEFLAKDAVGARYHTPKMPLASDFTPSSIPAGLEFLPSANDLLKSIHQTLSAFEVRNTHSHAALHYLHRIPVLSHYCSQNFATSCVYPQQTFKLAPQSLSQRCAHLELDQQLLLRMQHPDFLHLMSPILHQIDPPKVTLSDPYSQKLLRVLPLMAATGMRPTLFIPLAQSLTHIDQIELSKKPISPNFHPTVARWFCENSAGHTHHDRQVSALICCAFYNALLVHEPNNWLSTLGKTLKTDYPWFESARYFFDPKEVSKMEALLMHQKIAPKSAEPLARRNIRL